MYRLLIVEDEPLIRKGILTLIDFKALHISETFEAEDGLEGLSQFKAHQPHLVLLDINLPHLNGIDLAKEMKAIDPEVKIAILTGYDYFDYAVSALRIGVDNFVLKPVGKKDIAQILFELIQKIEDTQVKNAVNALSDTAVSMETESNASYKQAIHAYLEQHLFSSDFSLVALAQALSLNPTYLSTVFKTLYGTPFQEYVLNKRLEKAKLLLLSTSSKVYEIAYAVGFEDVNYFSTRFKKAFGISPSQFVQSVKGGQDGS